MSEGVIKNLQAEVGKIKNKIDRLLAIKQDYLEAIKLLESREKEKRKLMGSEIENRETEGSDDLYR